MPPNTHSNPPQFTKSAEPSTLEQAKRVLMLHGMIILALLYKALELMAQTQTVSNTDLGFCPVPAGSFACNTSGPLLGIREYTADNVTLRLEPPK